MINHDKDLAKKALLGAGILHKHAEFMAKSEDQLVRATGDIHRITADAIEHLVKKNEALRAQLVAFQRAAHPVVSFEPANDDPQHPRDTPFVKGARVCLKDRPYRRGTVDGTCIDKRRGHLVFVRFKSPFTLNFWVEVKELKLITDA
ncbi:hypothetical protein ACQUWL_03215 [Serratia marcescens]|uniref:hypothetical protein n=1 Tax=Serratia marcescens TaxID=615 RepID=UPI003D17EA6B